MNKIIVDGRFTRDPEEKKTKDGKTMAVYSLAMDKPGSDEAQYIRCLSFGRMAENILKFFGKGRKILLFGSLSINTYKNKEGVTIHEPVIIASEFSFMDSRKDTEDAAKTQKSEYRPVEEYEQDDDLPF